MRAISEGPCVTAKWSIAILVLVMSVSIGAQSQNMPEPRIEAGTGRTAQATPERQARDAASTAISATKIVSRFKAAPFQDPATGLVFMRERWYHPESGTFLTPDPEQFRDSSNLYAFTGGDPVNHSDPTGRYQADFHYGLTLFLAKRAGFCPDVARRIAGGTELPDQDPGRAPVTQGKIMKSFTASREEKSQAQDMLWAWHFPKVRRNEGAVVPGSRQARRFVDQALVTGQLSLLAQGLHPLQDSWSHRGIPSLDGVAGHPKERGGLLSTHTDNPWRWPQEALAAARASYDYLATFRLRYAHQAGRCSSQSPVTWSAIEPEVASYIALRSKSQKKAWLQLRGITMPSVYWDDVDDK